MNLANIIQYGVQAVIVVGLLVSAWYYCMTYVGARLFFRRRDAERGGETSLPGITILKPLKGLDADLFENLSTFCRQDYPLFQIVFGVADAEDPAIEVVHRLKQHYPNVRIDLVIDGRVYGSNYKVSNLHNMHRASLHDVLLIADSDIRVGPGYLRRIAAAMQDPQVGIVTCLYRAVNTGGLPTLVESLFINADFAPSILVARLVEETRYAFGATMALRRKVLDQIGGFLSVSNVLADDYFMGNRAVAQGYRVAICDVVVETVLAVGSWRRLWDHQLRWARTYRSVRGGSYFALALTHGVFWALVNLLWTGFAPWAIGVAGLLCGLRLVSASVVANRYVHAPMRWREIACILFKDLFGSAVWLLAFLGDTVRWSGHVFRVLPGGHMLRVGTEAAPLRAYAVAKQQDESASV